MASRWCRPQPGAELRCVIAESASMLRLLNIVKERHNDSKRHIRRVGEGRRRHSSCYHARGSSILAIRDPWRTHP